MSIDQPVKADERTAALAYAANTWGLNFLSFALLMDIMYRSVFLKETAWDLFALLFLSGAISMAYLARHKAFGQVYSWKMATILAVVAIVVAVVSAILAMAKIM